MTTNKQNTIVLCPAPRVGSTFIIHNIRSDNTYFNLGEFFYCNWYSTWIKSQVIKHMSDKRSDKIFNYTDWFKQLSFLLYKRTEGRFPLSNSPRVLQLFLKSVNEKLLTETMEFFNKEMQQNTVTKIFMSQTSASMYQRRRTIDLENILKYCDSLISVYRKDILLTWISEKKASANGLWLINNEMNSKKLEKSKEFKTTWNKEEYLSRYNCMLNDYLVMCDLYKNFNKPKCVIQYETLHKQKDKVAYLQNIYDKNKIDITINKNTFSLEETIKQSKDQNIENHFNNPEEFLKDYDDIKNTRWITSDLEI